MKEWKWTAALICIFGCLQSTLSWITVIHDYENRRREAISSQLLTAGSLISKDSVAFHRAGVAEGIVGGVSLDPPQPFHLAFPGASTSWFLVLLRVLFVIIAGVATDKFGHHAVLLVCGVCTALGGLLWPFVAASSGNFEDFKREGVWNSSVFLLTKLLLSIGSTSDAPCYVALSKCFLRSKYPTLVVACWISSRLAGTLLARAATAYHRRSHWTFEKLLEKVDMEEGSPWRAFLLDITSIQDSNLLFGVVIISSLLMVILSLRLSIKVPLSNLWDTINPRSLYYTDYTHMSESIPSCLKSSQQNQQFEYADTPLVQPSQQICQSCYSRLNTESQIGIPQGHDGLAKSDHDDPFCPLCHSAVASPSAGVEVEHLLATPVSEINQIRSRLGNDAPSPVPSTSPDFSSQFSWSTWFNFLITQRNVYVFCLTVSLATAIQSSHTDLFLRRLLFHGHSGIAATGGVVPSAPIWPYVGFVVGLAPARLSSQSDNKDSHLSISPVLVILTVAVLAAPLVGAMADVCMRWEKLSALGLLLLIFGRWTLQSESQQFGHSILGLSFALFWGCRGSALASNCLHGTEGSSYAVLKCGDFLGVATASYVISCLSEVSTTLPPSAPLLAFAVSILIACGILVLLWQQPTSKRPGLLSHLPNFRDGKLARVISVLDLETTFEIDQPPRRMSIGHSI